MEGDERMKRLIQRFIVWYLKRTVDGDGFHFHTGGGKMKRVVVMELNQYLRWERWKQETDIRDITKITASIGLDTSEFDEKMAKVMESLENLANKNEHIHALFREAIRVSEEFESSMEKIKNIGQQTSMEGLEKEMEKIKQEYKTMAVEGEPE